MTDRHPNGSPRQTGQEHEDHQRSGPQVKAQLIARLADGEATVNELVKPFDLSQPTISKHLKVLEQAG
ncbi:MAG TPA: metalloregulator ArsR/SmtB family transcription factor, partial [Dermatophilaceae bacterium]|nr:metalloregulator ArsR/SmtB family transcription factor [Dermatophilaceae bacterium]